MSARSELTDELIAIGRIVLVVILILLAWWAWDRKKDRAHEETWGDLADVCDSLALGTTTPTPPASEVRIAFVGPGRWGADDFWYHCVSDCSYGPPEADASVIEVWQDELPPGIRATSKEDVTHVACVTQIATEVQNCWYPPKVKTRLRFDASVQLVDVQTRKVLKDHYYHGGDPPAMDCPPRESFRVEQTTEYYYGSWPEIEEIAQQLARDAIELLTTPRILP